MSDIDPRKSRFSDFIIPEESLARAADIAVRQSLKIAPGEKTLIITNPVKDVSEIAFAVYDAVKAVEGIPVLIFQDPKRQSDSAEEVVLSAFDSRPDVVISLSSMKMVRAMTISSTTSSTALGRCAPSGLPRSRARCSA